MWIVKNLLKGTLLLQDVGLKVAAGDYFDLDAIGRDRAEGSDSLTLAFQEGYLQTIKKEGATADEIRRPTGAALPSLNSDDVARQLTEMRELIKQQQQQAMMQQAQQAQQQMAATQAQMQAPPAAAAAPAGGLQPADFKEAMQAMTQELVGGIKDQMDRLASQRVAIAGERQEVMSAQNMSETEIKARMALLDSKESELKTNLAELERGFGSQTEGDGAAASMADLLDDL